jgi:hypothetical protein
LQTGSGGNRSGTEAPPCSCKNHNLREPYLTSCLQKEKPVATIILTAWAASKAESDMDPGSVGREVKPKVRVVTMTVIMWFIVRSVIGITVPRIIMMVSVNPMVPVTSSVMFPLVIVVVVPLANLVMFLMTILVMVSLTKPCAAITCLRW